MADEQKVYVFKNLARLTRVTIWAIYVLCVIEGVSLLLSLVGVRDLQNAAAENSANLAQSVVLLVDFLVLAVTGILTLVWIYRANSNAHALTVQPMEFSPGWAVGWNFVPVAALWKPFQAVREIWEVSQSPGAETDGTPAILRWWWGLWIVNNIFSQISNRLMGDTGAQNAASDVTGMIGNAASIGACIFLIIVMRRIAGWQTEAAHADAVFA
jgi:hypothetical protein